MNASTIVLDGDLLPRFARAFAEAAASDVVLAEFAAAHPRRAGEIAVWAELLREMSLAGPLPAFTGGPAEPLLSEGQTLGLFRIVRRVAVGGMGEIYEAEQTNLGRPVALKVIRKGAASEAFRKRFEREQRVLARLHETHIVPVFFAGEEGEVQYFVMQHIEGATLRDVAEAVRRWPAPGGRTGPGLTELVESARRARFERLARTAAGAGPAEPRTAVAGAPRLPPAYFRAVALALAGAAESLAAAHRLKIVHRDLKPDNLMLDVRGRCWVIDFGLATAPGDATTVPEGGESGEGLTQGEMGTPAYMAPEQYEGKPADPRTDVWGLGATLYEMLTLRRAFDGSGLAECRWKVIGEEPPAPRSLVAGVPRDLDAVCRKALVKRDTPLAGRYASAGEFAADLRRFLRREPTVAYGARPPRRVALWAARNPGWAATFAAVLGIVGVTLALLVRGERYQRREVVLQQLMRLRLSSHMNGWRSDANRLVRDAAAIYGDATLRDHAAANRIGLDAFCVFERAVDASGVAFGPGGDSLLVGGDTPIRGGAVAGYRPALWCPQLHAAPRVSRQVGRGAVAVRADGRPLQLVPPEAGRDALVLWDVDGEKPLGEYAVPAVAPAGEQVLALSADGSRVAYGGPHGVWVWRAEPPELVGRIDRKATALAFAPDGQLLAVGGAGGEVAVYEGVALRTELGGDRARVNGLAFGPNLRRPSRGDGGRPGWLLAAGGKGGALAVWDLETRQLVSHFRGSPVDVHVVALSPDGVTLASAGRYNLLVWDVRSGQLLLTVPVNNYLQGVAFSPAGDRVAACASGVFGGSGTAQVWALAEPPEMRTLRGLNGQVGRTWFSGDGRSVAALSGMWQLGVWDAASGRLRHVFDAPPGNTTDNAGLAFDAGGRRLAFATSGGARLWDLASSRELGRWDLPAGLGEQIAFQASGRLVLFQTRRRPVPGVAGPGPTTCALYELCDGGAVAQLFDLGQFSGRVKYSAISPAGDCVVVEGLDGADGTPCRVVRAFDGLTGAGLWSRTALRDTEGLGFDPDGHVLWCQLSDGHVFVQPSTGEVLAARPPFGLEGLGNRFGLATRFARDGSRHNFELLRGAEPSPLVRLAIDRQATPRSSAFGPGGRTVAWGNDDGTVNLCDIELLRTQLERFGLGWPEPAGAGP